MDTLISNVTVVTMNEKMDVLFGAYIAITDGKITAAVLNGDMIKDYTGQYNESYGTGPNNHRMCGFTHFKNTEFIGEFPIASVSFNDEKFPANVKMTAFNPFILVEFYFLNPDLSSSLYSL